MNVKTIVALLFTAYFAFMTSPARSTEYYSFSSLSYSGNLQPGGQLSGVAVLTASSAIGSDSVCIGFASPSQYNFGNCQVINLNTGINYINFNINIPIDAELNTYTGTISVYNSNTWTLLAQSSTLATLSMTPQTGTYTFTSLNYLGNTKPNGQLSVTATLTTTVATTSDSVCVGFTDQYQYNFGECKVVTLNAGGNSIHFDLNIPADAQLSDYIGKISVYNSNPWTLLAESQALATLSVVANSTTSPPVLTGNNAVLLWEQDFSVTPLTLRSASSATAGVWMPNDMTWQSPVQGYVDFAASPCSFADVASGVCNMAGGTFDINPNDPTMLGISPFSQANGYLTISASRTPTNLEPAIQAEMTAQGTPGPIPSFIGGRLEANPAVFPGFTYGYFEFRAAFPNAGPGMFPALWFYSTPGQNPNMPHAEIDLLEFFGHSDVFYTTIHSGGATNNNGTTIGQHAGLIDGQFHTYGMDWTAQHIDFYADQQLIYSAPAPLVAAYQGVSLTPVMDYVADASWMASNIYLQANSTTPNPLVMHINYVRLYSVKPF